MSDQQAKPEQTAQVAPPQQFPDWARNGVMRGPAGTGQLGPDLLNGVTDGLHDLATAVRTFPVDATHQWQVVERSYTAGAYHAGGACLGLGVVLGLLSAALFLRFARR